MGDIITMLNDPGSAMQSVHGRPEVVEQFISKAALALNGDNRFAANQRAVRRGRSNLAAAFSKTTLLPKFIKEVEAVASEPGASTAETPAAKFQSA
jgi:hypothetical protein